MLIGIITSFPVIYFIIIGAETLGYGIVGQIIIAMSTLFIYDKGRRFVGVIK